MRRIVAAVIAAVLVFIVSEDGGMFALAAKPDAAACHGSGAKACATPSPTATIAPTPTPVPTATPTPTPTATPGADPFAAWTPPPATLTYSGNVPYPYANEPQPAPRVYVVRELASLTWTYTSYGYSQIAHDTQSLTEDDVWDRAFLGYLAPGETASIRIPVCQDPSARPGWGTLCAGGVGMAVWYAAGDPAVTAVLVTPMQGTLAFHPHANAAGENQGARYFGCFAYRGATFAQGYESCGSGSKWYTQPDGGTFWVRISNPTSRYVGIVARVWAGNSYWPMQAYFGAAEDRDIDIQPVDAPDLMDARLPYPAPPVVDYDGYTYDHALGAFWDETRLIVPDYPK